METPEPLSPEEEIEAALRFAQIDLQIDEYLRDCMDDLDEYEIEAVDRTLIVYYMRLCYMQGWRDRHHNIQPLQDD